MGKGRVWVLGVSLLWACHTSPPANHSEAPLREAPAPVVVEPETVLDASKRVLDNNAVQPLGEDSVSIVRRLDPKNLGRPAHEIADDIMDTVFYTASTLYDQVGEELDGISQSFAFNGNVIATIKLTRDSFAGLDYEQRMVEVGTLESAAWEAVAEQALTEEEAKTRRDDAERAAYADMLSALPRNAVLIDKRYRP
ncbi:MAG: hypothetical protein AAF997_13220 [Myxococcota bacterium]